MAKVELRATIMRLFYKFTPVGLYKMMLKMSIIEAFRMQAIFFF